jgi:hypothetical protein
MMWSGKEGIPQGLKPFEFCLLERPKAKALGYLEATTAAATTTAATTAAATTAADSSAALRNDK